MGTFFINHTGLKLNKVQIKTILKQTQFRHFQNAMKKVFSVFSGGFPRQHAKNNSATAFPTNLHDPVHLYLLMAGELGKLRHFLPFSRFDDEFPIV